MSRPRIPGGVVVAHDRTAIVAARRGNQNRSDAAKLQAGFAREIVADIDRTGMSVNSLAKAVNIKAGTLKGYLDGFAPWPIGVVKDVARVLGRSSDADLVALGYLSSSLAQRFLLQDQQLRLIEALQAKTAVHVAREPLVESAGAQVVAAIITSPDELAGRLTVRIGRLTRGRARVRTFCDLVIVDVPAPGQDYDAAKSVLLRLPVQAIPGQATAQLADVLDYYGAHVEETVDYVARLRRMHTAGPTTVMIIVPGLLATRPPLGGAKPSDLNHLDGVAVAGLHWCGAPDIASLIADRAGWGYAAAEMLTRQAFGGGRTLRLPDEADAAGRRAFHIDCREISGLLLGNRAIARRRAVALDEPAEALDALRHLDEGGEPPNPVALVRISPQRVRWTCKLRARERGRAHDWVDQETARLLALQDDLTAAVESIDSPAQIFDLPEPAVDYTTEGRDFVDEDFDSYAAAAEEVQRWLAEMGGETDDAH